MRPCGVCGLQVQINYKTVLPLALAAYLVCSFTYYLLYEAKCAARRGSLSARGRPAGTRPSVTPRGMHVAEAEFALRAVGGGAQPRAVAWASVPCCTRPALQNEPLGPA